jgi:hypothetical protein
MNGRKPSASCGSQHESRRITITSTGSSAQGIRNGAARGIRTPDPLITNEVLYQLSYCGFQGRSTTLLTFPTNPQPCSFSRNRGWTADSE